MKLQLFLMVLILFMACTPRDHGALVMAQPQPEDSTKMALSQAGSEIFISEFRTRENILAYFDELIATEKILVGQQCGDGPEQANDHYQDFVASLAGKTNRYAAIVGADVGRYPRTGYLFKTLLRHWKEGGLVTLSWHAENPFANDANAYGNPFENGHRINMDSLLRSAPESAVKSSYRKELDVIAGILQELRDAGVVVIWRPFPQVNGNRFWWGLNSWQDTQAHREDFRALWVDLYETLTYDYGLDNLLWTYSVLPGTARNAPVSGYYPGSDYVDLVGMDYSGPKPGFPDFQTLKSLGKTLVISETGPSAGYEGTWDELHLVSVLAGKAAFFIQWHSYPGTALAIQDNLKANDMMNSERVVTLDEIRIFPVDHSN